MKIKATHLVLDDTGELRVVYETEEGLYFLKDTVGEFVPSVLEKEDFEKVKLNINRQYLEI